MKNIDLVYRFSPISVNFRLSVIPIFIAWLLLDLFDQNDVHTPTHDTRTLQSNFLYLAIIIFFTNFYLFKLFSRSALVTPLICVTSFSDGYIWLKKKKIHAKMFVKKYESVNVQAY